MAIAHIGAFRAVGILKNGEFSLCRTFEIYFVNRPLSRYGTT